MKLNRRQILRLMGISTGATLLPELVPTAAMIDAVRPSADDLPALTADHPVLLTDDDHLLLKLEKMILERYSQYTVIATTNSHEVLRLCRSVPVSLVISDIMRPDMDGLTLCQYLKADPATRHIPVILASACCGARSDGLAAGAVDYLVKPLLPSEFFNAVQHALIHYGNWRPL